MRRPLPLVALVALCTPGASAEHSVSFTVVLHVRDGAALEQLVAEVSDPAHSRYGQYLGKSELRTLVEPPLAAVQAVRSWFERGACTAGAASAATLTTTVLAGGDSLRVEGTVGAVEARIGSTLRLVREGSRVALRAAVEPVLPACAAEHVAFLSLFAPIHATRSPSVRALAHGRDTTMAAASSNASAVSVSTGNDAARLAFTPVCSDGSLSVDLSPCASKGGLTSLTATVAYGESGVRAALPPMKFDLGIGAGSIAVCEPPADANATSICWALVGPLPMHRTLRASVTSGFANHNSTTIVSAEFACIEITTPSLLRGLYGAPSDPVAHGATNAVAEFYGEFYADADTAAFFASVGEPARAIAAANVLGNLPNNQSHPGGEATLDVQYLLAMAPNATTRFYSYSSLNPYSHENEGFLTWLLDLAAEESPPAVHSLSYGDIESTIYDASNASALEYARRMDLEFAKLAARGVSVLVASGDDGVGSFLARSDESACGTSRPEWPASSPYVTTVGATQLDDRHSPLCSGTYSAYAYSAGGVAPVAVPTTCSSLKEVVCSSSLGGVITSGGGFSNVHGRPAWQAAAVDAYLASGAAPATPGFFNTKGRGYPDLAALGSAYYVHLGGSVSRLYGTSASTPVAAGLVTLLNDARAAVGAPPMGFINPFLYQAAVEAPAAFNDVVGGDNACAAGGIGSATCCAESFAASVGWDAVSGLGSPNFGVLLQHAVAAYPPPPPPASPVASPSMDDDAAAEAGGLGAAVALALVFGAIALVLAVSTAFALIFGRPRGARPLLREVKPPLQLEHKIDSL